MAISKLDWALSLQAGDQVVTHYRELTNDDLREVDFDFRPQYTTATVEHVFTEAFTQSRIGVKLKEFPFQLDIFWIQPHPDQIQSYLDRNQVEKLLKESK